MKFEQILTFFNELPKNEFFTNKILVELLTQSEVKIHFY